jgi:RluA family pseudouridine synthase
VQPKHPEQGTEAPLELSCRVPADAAGSTLAGWLARRFRYRSEAEWSACAGAGDLRVDGAVAAADRILCGGERVTTRMRWREPDVDDRIALLHIDAEIVVATKPALLPVHADGPFVRHTFVALLADRVGPPRPRLVHRLDRETSGVILAARTRAAARALEQAFAAGQVGKRYLAVVHGVVAQPRLVVDLPLGPAPGSAISMRQGPSPSGKPAVTELEVVARGPAHTLLRAQPRTGRTHQIRAHLEAIGHAVVGDKLYGRSDDEWLAFIAHVKAGGDQAFGNRYGVAHHLLHAESLQFPHPRTAELVEFTAEPPAEFQSHWRELGGEPA